MAYLSSRLREVVHQSVGLLGDLIRLEFGSADYQLIESLRVRMTKLRGVSTENASRSLRQEFHRLKKLSPERQTRIAHAFTLMLELMNACENAYRSSEIHKRTFAAPENRPDSVIYVLTAHPTEARSPENIAVFHAILCQLVTVFQRPDVRLSITEKQHLQHSLNLALRTRIVRERRPRVQDEAEQIYSTLLRDETLRTLLHASEELAPIYFRSWVGGDKDGHPGVDEKVFLDSLRLSRSGILGFCSRRLNEVKSELKSASSGVRSPRFLKRVAATAKLLPQLRAVKSGDVNRVKKFRRAVHELAENYESEFGIPHPSLRELKRLLHIFPALVVPLEFRESSDVLMSPPAQGSLAIDRMLQALASVSKGGDPLWYVRGFIISMTCRFEHLQAAAELIRRRFGSIRIPIIPLFEQIGALQDAPSIVSAMLKDREFKSALRRYWNGRLEVMLGYSDSSKESGVLKSRLQLAETMHALDRLCVRHGVLPFFFQGSGGSTDRGGGSIPEQTAWWTANALRNYKVTIQGEMVERSLASPDITRGQIERIVQSAGVWKSVKRGALVRSKALEDFAQAVADRYEASIHDERFLSVIERATPYPFLDLLKFGSRPSKRAKGISVRGLRAIPWILCWTQTRVLFPTWWGVGSAWSKASAAERKQLARASRQHPVFATYVRALGYTLAKVELPVWRAYLEESDLSPELKKSTWAEFEREFKHAMAFARAMLGSRELIAWRPWLQESITLRSPMIHPLNLLQIIAMESGDAELLRLTVAGVSSGMMTTG